MASVRSLSRRVLRVLPITTALVLAGFTLAVGGQGSPEGAGIIVFLGVLAQLSFRIETEPGA
jgi:hypothetical protein